MNPEMISMMVKQMLGNALKSGATSMIEDAAESFSADDLGRLIAVLQKVQKKKQTTVETVATQSR